MESSFSDHAIPYVILQACDAITTMMGLYYGVVGEANPIFAHLHPLAVPLLKLAAVPVLLYVANTAWMVSPRVTRIGFHLSVTFLLLVVLNNTVQVGLGLAWA